MSTQTAAKVWFITGASKGLGREWAAAALDRGDSVAAAARSAALLEELADEYGDRVLPIPLDVRDREAAFEAVAHAHDRFGHLDIVVNNAGYGVYGAVEELSEQEVRDLLDTNFFGALWVTQAALPFLREQGSGHFIQVSSVGGVTASPSLGAYHSSKWALEAISQSLAQEVGPLGIKVTIVEPTGYKTGAEAAARNSSPIGAYDTMRQQQEEIRAMIYSQAGDPKATRDAIIQVVDAEQPPLRILLGDGALAFVTSEQESRLDTWRAWESVSIAAHGSTGGA